MKSVELDDNLSRFLLQKSHFSSENQRVKYAAFMPFNRQTSVFITSGLAEHEIWELGEKEVAQKRDKSLKGRADISVSQVASKLEVTLDEPPPRHANIVGWSDEKSAQKITAIELATIAVLYLCE